MISLQEILKEFGAGLADVVPETYHYFRPVKELPYCIWQEDGEETSFSSGNHKQEQQIHGTIDYFTKTEYDEAADDIQNFLNDSEMGWRLLSVEYEDETAAIHYVWEWWRI